jgi:GNAT superfamily N-acetyltransferase
MAEPRSLIDRRQVKIEYLSDRPEFLQTLARWHFQEWSALRPGDSVEARLTRLKGWSGRGGIPHTIIALSDDELLLGSASLIEHDMDDRLELTPWLAGVFVAPEHRRHGVGSALVRRIMDETTSLQVPRLYLYTVDSTPFYASLGWSLAEKTRYREKEVSIMSFTTPAEAP